MDLFLVCNSFVSIILEKISKNEKNDHRICNMPAYNACYCTGE